MALGWKGLNGEDEMSDKDWQERARLYGTGLLGGATPEETVPDNEGTPTFGCYNGDYTEAEHERANQRYEQDEEYQANVDDAVRKLDYLNNEFF